MIVQEQILFEFFINNGLPWTPVIKKFLSEQGSENVDLLKLLKDDELDALFVNEKIAQKRLASVVFKDLQADCLKAYKCVTQTLLKPHDSEPTPSTYPTPRRSEERRGVGY